MDRDAHLTPTFMDQMESRLQIIEGYNTERLPGILAPIRDDQVPHLTDFYIKILKVRTEAYLKTVRTMLKIIEDTAQTLKVSSIVSDKDGGEHVLLDQFAQTYLPQTVEDARRHFDALDRVFAITLNRMSRREAGSTDQEKTWVHSIFTQYNHAEAQISALDSLLNPEVSETEKNATEIAIRITGEFKALTSIKLLNGHMQVLANDFMEAAETVLFQKFFMGKKVLQLSAEEPAKNLLEVLGIDRMGYTPDQIIYSNGVIVNRLINHSREWANRADISGTVAGTLEAINKIR